MRGPRESETSIAPADEEDDAPADEDDDDAPADEEEEDAGIGACADVEAPLASLYTPTHTESRPWGSCCSSSYCC